MAELPDVVMDITADSRPVVVLEETEIFSPETLATHAPALLDPRFAPAYAQLVNHLAHGFDYEVIVDPAAFEADYRADIAAEGTVAEDPFGDEPLDLEPLDGAGTDEDEDEADDGGTDPDPEDIGLEPGRGDGAAAARLPGDADDEVAAPEPGAETVEERIARTGRVPLSVYGVPDFAAIAPPEMEGDTLVFFARHLETGLAYRVTMERGGTPDYAPMATAPD